MGKFGWSLPPGCSSLPGEDAILTCDVCGGDAEISSVPKFGDCICDECPECGEYGNPRCYELAPGGCGKKMTPNQKAQKAYFDVLWAETEKEQEETMITIKEGLIFGEQESW